MNTVNKKLAAMGLNSFEFYENLFVDFNNKKLNTPRVTVFNPPIEYTNMDFFTNYPEAYSYYKRDGIFITGEATLNIGDMIYVAFSNFGNDVTNVVEITENGFRILEETTTYIAGVCLYPGVRNDFFKEVGLPDIGLSHQIFDAFVSNYSK